ncbi:hypothetical protein KDA_50260 [Dictyobacter alpinus]|uniref:Right handed beta helix domain-containing protein n=1 Tax=Dictyobacter alpinus TaxID=2014873 RepID=A0A402BE21_9CHLR|nr:right-handed parallel beta-helix repeat-containing protein [Dictyobacter alpinus]GCE29542.1 hypothetical protein KDA_50260 [Dictyobacter alpinus]
MKNRKDVYTRRAVLATLASGSLGLTAYALLSHTESTLALSANSPHKQYYIKAGASPKNDGLSPNRPFPTIQQAADLTNPGDTVYIMNGTYGETSSEGAAVITRSGAPNAYITYRAFPGHHPKIHVSPAAWNSLLVESASYITIAGLTIEGNSASYTYDEALANQNTKNPKYNANGIGVRPTNATAPIPHHIRIIGNVVHHCPGGGIYTDRADYITMKRNIAYSNAWYSVYANSGISAFHFQNTDQKTGYKNFVLQNISFDNQSYIPWTVTHKISDGNGIIIDDTKNKQIQGVPYVGRTFVANNLAFENGGSGIHAFSSENVDIINNTVWNNARSPELTWASLFASSSNNVNIFNNIAVIRPGKPTNDTSNNTNVIYDYNIYYHGNVPAQMGAHDLIADPLFIHPSSRLNEADFSLRPQSPARDSGTSHLAPNVDITGSRRPVGKGFDRGAYEGLCSVHGWDSIQQWREQAL